MSYKSQLKGGEFRLAKDQNAARDAYFSIGQVCVDAGAGTGKTMTMVEIACDVVLSQPPGPNPFKRLLIVTFGVEASRELKTRIRCRLKEHEDAGGTLHPDTFRYLESQSDIQTIDSLISSLISEIAMDVGMSLTFEIADTFTQNEILDEVFSHLLSDPQMQNAWDDVHRLYPDTWDPYGPESIRNMLWSTHQKMREFCWNVDEVERSLLVGLDSMHAKHTPPNSIADIEDIIRKSRKQNAILDLQNKSQSEAISDAADVYQTTRKAIEDLVKLLRRFDDIYDEKTLKEGLYSYVDLSYIIWRYMQTPDGRLWKEDLSSRYDDVMIDEYQDTSFVQDEILRSFIRDNGPKDFTRILFIGDVKQSIYQWRSAEPSIFLNMIDSLSNGQKLSSPLSRMKRTPLVTNFRSHPSLIDFYNATFSEIFADPLRGAVSGDVPYEVLVPPRTVSKKKSSTRIHVLSNQGGSKSSWVEEESVKVAKVVAGALSALDSSDNKEKYKPSDVALLFRRTTTIPDYVDALRERGLKCAVLADISLFREIEVSLVIDVLDWLSNPNSKDSLLRILRSPIVALSDKTLRYLVSEKLYLTTALNNWPVNHLNDDDKYRLEQLVKLRDDVRWDREGPKTDMLSKIIAHSFLDTVVTASSNGLQAHANLWLFVELVSTWESEEIMGYNAFVSRLMSIREDATGPMGRDYPRAILADDKSKDSIKVMTVHAAKGLEFPIVFLCDCVVQTGTMAIKERMVRSRTKGMLIKPVPTGGTRKISGMVRSSLTNKPLDWIAPRSESLLWVSPSRNPTNGEFLCRGLWQGALHEEQAEFWRLLYVAATRAKDHLFFSIAIDDEKGNMNYSPSWSNMDEYPWTSWMPALRSAIDFPSLAKGAVNSVSRNILGTARTVVIPVGYDEITPRTTTLPAKISYTINMGTKLKALTYKPPKYVPASLSASSCGILLECPRRYQYELLWRVSKVRERLQRSKMGLTNALPQGVSPDRWGTAVHRLLEIRDFSQPFDHDPEIQDMLDPNSGLRFSKQFNAGILTEMGKATKNFENTSIYNELIKCISRSAEVHREFKVHATLQVPGYPDIPVHGFIDLLYQDASGSWIAVDYKAEPKPDPGCFQERVHQTQLSAYAWLLDKHYGWTVSKCAVVYLYPTPEVLDFTPSGFDKQVISAIQSISIDHERGLIARPGSGPIGPCYLCPYASSIGGPCEHG